MLVRLTRHARIRARQRRIPLSVIEEIHRDPEWTRPSRTDQSREIRSRRYSDQVIEIVVDLTDGSVVSVWYKVHDA